MASNANEKLPTGDYCRQLIGQPYVTQSELRSLLRARGIFLSGSDKKLSAIPIIKTGFSVKEYQRLKQSCKTREESPKSFTRTMVWSSTENLVDVLSCESDLKNDFDDNFGTLQLSQLGQFVYVDGNPNHLMLDFSIARTNPIKNWSGEAVEYSGRLELKRIVAEDGVNYLLATGNYTSKETLDFSRSMFNRVAKDLKSSGAVSNSSKPTLVRFHSFDNEGRVEFLKELSCSWSGPDLFFMDTKDINFSPDNLDADAPDELRWMEGKISELKLMGRDIHRAFFYTNKKSHKYLFVFENVCTYAFKLVCNDLSCEGECRLSIGFSDKDQSDSELVVEVISCKVERNNTGLCLRDIQNEILRKFDMKKLDLFNKFRIK